jgi:hypothetical protein
VARQGTSDHSRQLGQYAYFPAAGRATSLDMEEQYARQHTEEAAVSSKTKSMPIGIHCFRLPVCANTICPSSPL